MLKKLIIYSRHDNNGIIEIETDNISNFSTFYTRPALRLRFRLAYEVFIRFFVRLVRKKEAGQKLLSPLSRLLYCKDEGGGTIVTTLAFITS